MEKYQIAIYIRLSKEDDKAQNQKFFSQEIGIAPQVSQAAGKSTEKGAVKSTIIDRKEESNSITMQRVLLKKYVAENFTDYELLEFCDDGYTGTNFVEVR